MSSRNRSTHKRRTTLAERSNDSACLFSFADGRRCRMPRSGRHPHLCAYHARKEAHALAGEQIGRELSLYLSGHYVTANDLTAALGRLFVAVAQGRVKPKTASTLAYLGQTLTQILPLAQHEFINAYSPNSWCRTIRDLFDAPAPAPNCSIPASTQPGGENPALKKPS